jgi:hypothetical protein
MSRVQVPSPAPCKRRGRARLRQRAFRSAGSTRRLWHQCDMISAVPIPAQDHSCRNRIQDSALVKVNSTAEPEPQIRSLGELEALVCKIAGDDWRPFASYLFRGQASESWGLAPAVERPLFLRAARSPKHRVSPEPSPAELGLHMEAVRPRLGCARGRWAGCSVAG